MSLKITPLSIAEVKLITGTGFEDDRGYFMEGYKRSEFAQLGLSMEFRQDNISRSRQGVLRGLHYQLPPNAQAKLVRVLLGKIWDVAVDIRKNSPTFKQWVAAELSDQEPSALFIPEGFAHGFLVLSDEALVLYKTSAEYAASSERGIIWNDPELNISWPVKNPILSEKDQNYPKLLKVEIFP